MTKQADSPSLDDLRQKIDAIDDQILELIHQRTQLAADVGARKSHHGNAPFYVPSREASIIRRLLARQEQRCAHDHQPRLSDAALHGIFREIIGSCLALEHPMRVAYLGPKGTFSYQAALRQFGSSVDYLALDQLAQVFQELEAGRVMYGVVPLENAFAGAVADTLDQLMETSDQTKVCAEILLSIHHQLMSYAECLDDVQVVYSHAQPFSQCQAWLQAFLPHAELREMGSTVQGAAFLREQRKQGHDDVWKHGAVIGPSSIADEYDMSILVANIEDKHDNTTRFLVIAAHDAKPSGEDKTSLIMSMSDQAGSLYQILAPFAQRSIGLSRIESRPSKRKLWEYIFFIDVEGHRDDALLAAALAELEAVEGCCLRVLGSYPVSRIL